MDITPPASDKGTQLLKLENENSTVKPTAAVAPYPRIESSEERHERHPPLTVERRQGQRRDEEERRQQRTETLFDTRSEQDRRNELRRQADREKPSEEEDSSVPIAARGVDELA